MRFRKLSQITIAFLALCIVANPIFAQDENKVISTPPVTTVQGTQVIKPATGTGGKGAQYNFLPYNLPGQEVTDTGVTNNPFIVSYVNRNQPVQTSDWWTGIGLQWSTSDQKAGWVVGRSAGEGQIGRSQGFISEPFHMQFLDVGPQGTNPITGIPLLVHGLRFWNQNTLSVRTDGAQGSGGAFDASNNYAGRGEISSERSPIVTVGLANVHPLGVDVRTQAPWSNVVVQSYSDWGVVISYADQGSELTTTLANGSPFAWLERTKGSAPFVVWTGFRDRPGVTYNVWYNRNGVIGVTVTSDYVPYNGLPTTSSTASYIIFSDQGDWTEQKASSESVSMFTNPTATRVTVLGMPHNIDPNDNSALIAAMTDLGQYACQKIVNTKVHYPPIPGSDASVTAGGQTLALGFDEKNSVIRTKLEVTTAPFQMQIPGTCGAAPLQIVFPHHRKAMIAASRQNIPTANGTPKYVWNSVIGELYAYQGASYVRELTNFGALPFLPSVAISAGLQNPLQPGQSAAEDIYQTMKTWFFLEEPTLPGKDKDGHDIPAHINSFVRNVGTYINVQTNTYIQNIAGVYEMIGVAEQLAQAPQLSGIDPDAGKSKQAVAAEMRDVLLQTLKELVGQWADVYTAQCFQYNPQYNSFMGYPEGYGSVQNFNDHHFHYGYFLRSAAVIGRYDKDWLTQYMPLIDNIRRDVATYDRSDTQYPFLREFSPFYGHNWADGTGQNGQNQESVSEAMNFARGLVELGWVLGDQKLRDLGIYLFEEEALAAEQYWFNQDANLAQSSGKFYNGNWPDEFVHYTGPDGNQWKTTLITNVKQFGVFRNTFFGGIEGSYTIQETPMSAYSLFVGRNPAWLKETWNQYLLDSGGSPQGPYEVIVAGFQAQIPGSGSAATDTGLAAALQRINTVHNFFPGTPNTLGKHWAYTLAALGQVDAGVVADTASYGVFNKNGQRAYVAYNPTGSQITVTFTDRTSGAKKSLDVPAFSMLSELMIPPGISQAVLDKLTPSVPDAGRFYLRADHSLTAASGSWMLPAGSTSYPGDGSALNPSLVVVPVRSDQDGKIPNPPQQQPPYPPPASDIRTWTGTFSGSLIDPAKPVTRFAIYTNQNVFPGWQQDPSKAGNTMVVRFIYDFDSDGKPDRIEALQNAPLSSGNTFILENKVTEYIGDRYISGPIGASNVFIGGPDDQGAIRYMDPYPSHVTNGTLTVQLYGGSNINTQFLHPYAVSVDASPLTNRASWVKPPYEISPGPLPPSSQCSTICLASPQYYLNNLDRLPRGSVHIGNTLVSTDNKEKMRDALDGGHSAAERLNQQYVAAQLSLLAAHGPDRNALSSRLECYGTDFAPVVLGSGATLTPKATLKSLMDQSRIASRSGGAKDLTSLADLLDLINGAQCR